MNICKRIIAAALTLMMVMTVAGLPLQAKERRGSTVAVTMADGSQVQGELLAVKGHNLIIHDKSREQGFNVNIEQVAEIRIKKRSRFFPGLAIGLVAGMGIGSGIYNAQAARDSDPCQLTPYAIMSLIIPCVTAIVGGGVGAILSSPKKMPIERQTAADIEASLRYLQNHARYSP